MRQMTGSLSRLTALRGDKSPETVAAAIGISMAALTAYEAGARTPRDDVKQRFASFYGVSMSDLFQNEFTVADAMELHDALEKIDADQLKDVADVIRSLSSENVDVEAIMDDAYRLARARRTARRNGIQIVRQSGRSIGESKYMLRDMVADIIIAGADPAPFSLSLDDIEGWISCMEEETDDE